MNTFMPRWLIYPLLAACLLAGCVRLNRQSPAKISYVFSAARPSLSATDIGAGVLQVTPLRISPQFAGRSFIYRMGESRYQPDFYHEFLVSPASMVQEETVDWLSESGLFSTVSVSAGPLPPDYLLQGRILKLYGDFRPDRHYGIIEISFMLLDQHTADNPILLQRRYRAQVGMEDASPEALINAWDVGLTGIFEGLEKDLRALLATRTEVPARSR